MKYRAEVAILLKETVLDPQGDVVRRSLEELGYRGINGVRTGKFMQVERAAPDREGARAQVEDMCSRLLANPVIEEYRFQLEEVGPC